MLSLGAAFEARGTDRDALIALASTVAVGAGPGSAQEQIRLTQYGNGLTINTTEYGTVRTSPYQGYFVGDPTTPLIDFFCIDFEHYAPSLNTNYSVYSTQLAFGDISMTRHGGEPGALAKVGEGGVAVDTVEDMMRLYDRFDLEKVGRVLEIAAPYAG